MSINEDFKIENGVLIEYIGSEKDIVIPENVTTIENDAFDNCSNLTSITIGKNLKNIGNDIFSECKNLINITVNENNPYFSSVDNILYDKDMTKIICVPKSIKGSITIPNGITDIVDSAFADCENLKSITIPSSVTTIREDAFSDCNSLESIIIPDSVTSIGGSAFSDCESLESIIIPDSVTSIGYMAFFLCRNLKEIKIPDKVTTLSGNLFARCENLISITLSKTLTTIGEWVFCGCINLENITTIPCTVTSIDTSAFCGCKKLKSIPVDENNPKFSSIDGILYDKEVKTLIQAPNGIEGSIIIPDSVTSIKADAFYECENLTDIKISKNVTYIGGSAFNKCENLNSITIDKNNPNFSSIDGILYDTNAKKIITLLPTVKESVTIIDGITTIGEKIFKNCKNLKSITLSDSITTIEERAFEDCTNLESIIIPDSVITIEKGAFGGCESLQSIVLPPNITTIEGDFFKGGIFNNCKSLENIVIPSSVTSIKNYAFERCSSLKNINIPDSVTSIEVNAFKGCTSLSNVIIGKGLKTIEDEAFTGCKSLDNISVDESNPYFSSIDGALYDKDAKTLILVPANSKNQFIIPSSVTTIESEAFINCQNLNSINVDENNPNLTSIDGVLYDKEAKTLLLVPCAYKDSLKISKSVIDINSEAFDYCEDLSSITVDKNNPNFFSLDDVLYGKEMKEILFVPPKIKGSITIADTITNIENFTFASDNHLESISLPKSVTELDDYSFNNCENLINISVDENNPNFSSFNGVLYDKDMKEILFVPQKIKGPLTIADTVLEIDLDIFEDCEDLECLIIPQHLKESFENFDQCKVIIK